MFSKFALHARPTGLVLIAVLLTLPGPSVAQTGRVAYSDMANIYTMQPDGSDLVRLTYNDGSNGWPSWSPDGSKILFVKGNSADSELYTMNADGSNPRRLTFDAGDKGSPDWSPDGSKIVYQANWYGNGGLYIVDADGSNRVYLNIVGSHPRWSPDGTKIAFSAYYRNVPNGEQEEVFTMNADGSNVTRLTKTGLVYDGFPTWSPDGTKIAWLRGFDYGEIWTMNADGSNPRRLVSGARGKPVWGRNGEIMFISDGLSVISSDGFDQTRLTNNPGTPGNMLWSWHAPAVPYSLTLSSNVVAGGVLTSGTVTYLAPTYTRRNVRMSDNSDYVLMSASCVVPANQTTGTFKIWTYGVTSMTMTTITSAFFGDVKTANLTLTPATLDLLWLSPTSVVGGNPSMGNVRLIGKAPMGGAVVALATNNPPAANHASSVTISYGASLRQFPVSTFGVDSIQNAVISATYAGVTRTAVISVRPATLSALALASNSLKGGDPVVATVEMNGKTGPLGRTVLLTSDQPKITVPASMYVPPQKFSWNFTVLTQSVTSNTVGTITATQGAITRTATLTLTP